jgi:hypothetical protein
MLQPGIRTRHLRLTVPQLWLRRSPPLQAASRCPNPANAALHCDPCLVVSSFHTSRLTTS